MFSNLNNITYQDETALKAAMLELRTAYNERRDALGSPDNNFSGGPLLPLNLDYIEQYGTLISDIQSQLSGSVPSAFLSQPSTSSLMKNTGFLKSDGSHFTDGFFGEVLVAAGYNDVWIDPTYQQGDIIAAMQQLQDVFGVLTRYVRRLNLITILPKNIPPYETIEVDLEDYDFTFTSDGSRMDQSLPEPDRNCTNLNRDDFWNVIFKKHHGENLSDGLGFFTVPCHQCTSVTQSMKRPASAVGSANKLQLQFAAYSADNVDGFWYQNDEVDWQVEPGSHVFTLPASKHSSFAYRPGLDYTSGLPAAGAAFDVTWFWLNYPADFDFPENTFCQIGRASGDVGQDAGAFWDIDITPALTYG